MATEGSPLRSARIARSATAFAVLLILLAASPDASAQSTADKAVAESLFREARDLMAAHKYSEACRKFEASHKLDPAAGTALNLGDCFEQDGRTASAWGAFREAEDLARRTGDPAREVEARRRHGALESKLVRLRIDVPGQSRVQGLVVRRDGIVVDPAMFGSEVPVDPGKHVVEAVAPGRKRWHLEVGVNPGGESGEVLVPVLRPVVESTGLDPSAFPVAPGPAREPSSTGLGAQRWIAIGAGVAGLLSFGTATVYWMKARSTWSDAVDRCPAYTCRDPNDVALESEARDQSGIATVTALTGLGLVGVGTLLWATAPARATQRETAPAVSLSSWGTGLSVRGTY